MSRASSVNAASTRSFPRVSGDEPQYTITVDANMLFSPRERG